MAIQPEEDYSDYLSYIKRSVATGSEEASERPSVTESLLVPQYPQPIVDSTTCTSPPVQRSQETNLVSREDKCMTPETFPGSSYGPQITRLTVRADVHIHAVSVEWDHGRSETYGGKEGKESVFQLLPGEFVTEIRGNSGYVLNGLSFFTTEGRVLGPVGKGGGVVSMLQLAPPGAGLIALAVDEDRNFRHWFSSTPLHVVKDVTPVWGPLPAEVKWKIQSKPSLLGRLRCKVSEHHGVWAFTKTDSCELSLLCSHCGEVQTRFEHLLGRWVFTLEGNCQQERRCPCRRMKETRTEHQWNEWSYTDSTSCLRQRVCIRCSLSQPDTEANHCWQAWLILPGVCMEERKCHRCAASQQREISHSFGNYTFTAEGSCQLHRICTRCGRSESGTVEHQWGPWLRPIPTECIEQCVCIRCDSVQERSVDHSWGAIDFISPSSCRLVQSCGRCSEKRGVREEHRWGVWCSHPGGHQLFRKCQRCQQEEQRLATPKELLALEAKKIVAGSPVPPPGAVSLPNSAAQWQEFIRCARSRGVILRSVSTGSFLGRSHRSSEAATIWLPELCEKGVLKFMNKETRRFLRINKDHVVDFEGHGGMYCQFRVVLLHPGSLVNILRSGNLLVCLESVSFPGERVGILSSGRPKDPRHTGMGPHGQFYITLA